MNSVVGLYRKNISFSIDLEIQGIQGSVYTTAPSQEENKILFGTQEGRIYAYKIQNEETLGNN